MTAHTALLNPFIASFAELVAGASWAPWSDKDLSPGGACETGYGDRTEIHSGLQYLTDLKHSEKHTPYVRWAVVTAVPLLLDVLPTIIEREGRSQSGSNKPGRIHAAVKEKLGNISAQQLGFILSVVPLYHNTRALKNFIWPGTGFDPSGHTMFKVAQYGMLYSVTTDHGTRSRINTATICYIAFTSIADAVMLNNTIANCHTLAEIAAGGAMGVAILFAAHLISKHTSLGDYAQRGAKTVGRALYEGGIAMVDSLNSIRRGLFAF